VSALGPDGASDRERLLVLAGTLCAELGATSVVVAVPDPPSGSSTGALGPSDLRRGPSSLSVVVAHARQADGVGAVEATGPPVVLWDQAAAGAAAGRPPQPTSHGDAVACAITAEGHPIGLLVAHGPTDTEAAGPVLVEAAARCGPLLAHHLLTDSERRHRLGLEHVQRHLALLVRAGDALASASTDLVPVLGALADVVVPLFADWFAVDLAPEVLGPGVLASSAATAGPAQGVAERAAVVSAVGADPDRQAGADRYSGRSALVRVVTRGVLGEGTGASQRAWWGWSDPADGVGRQGAAPAAHRDDSDDAGSPVAAVLATGRSVLVARRPARRGGRAVDGPLGNDGWLGPAESAMVVPVRSTGTVVGVLGFATGSERRGFRPSDLQAAEGLAERVAVAIERVGLWHAQRRLADEAARSRQRLQAVVDASPVAIVEVDDRARPLWWNTAAARMLDLPPCHRATVAGPSESRFGPGGDGAVAVPTPGLVGGGAADAALGGAAVPDWLGRLCAEAVRAAPTSGMRCTVEMGDGEVRHLSWSAAPVADRAVTGDVTLVLVEDVTERQRLADEMVQAERLSAMAQLAGTVAHDFNNLLTVILGSGELLVQGLDDDDGLRPEAQAIVAAGQRAADLTSQLLSIGQRRPFQPRPTNPDDVVASMLGVLQRVVGDAVAVHHHAAPVPVTILVEPAELERALLNLTLNARDAMPEGGRLDLIVTRTSGGDDGTRPMVEVAVADTGCGMAPEVVERCLEPFFSTKARGRGSGLGLASVHSVVVRAGGTLGIGSTVGAGTTVRLRFPEVAGMAHLEGGWTVLVVDDDPAARRVAVEALVADGWEVLAASDGAEALEAVAAVSGQLDLVVTDVSMSGIGGVELAAMLVSSAPELPVLYVTGGDAATLPAGASVVAKPFTASALVQRARAMVAGAGPATRSASEAAPSAEAGSAEAGSAEAGSAEAGSAGGSGADTRPRRLACDPRSVEPSPAPRDQGSKR
jgi:signal transduction histidine kinase/CheY-like chemotaxis protein/GAF domain-containing protein